MTLQLYKFVAPMNNSASRNLKSSLVGLLMAASLTMAPAALAQDAAPTKAAAESTKAESDKSEGDKLEGDKAATSSAEAAPTEEEREAARVAFEEGSQAFEEGNYPAAAEAYKKALDLIPSPHAQYWVAKSLDLADSESEKPADTLAAYTKLLTNPGAVHVGADKVAEAQLRVEALKKLVPAKVKLVTTPAGATVTVDGVEHPQKAPTEVSLTHGPHKIEISSAGYETLALDFAAEGGSTVEQQIQLAPVPVVAPIAAPPPQEEEPKQKSIVPAVVTLGLGGAGLIAGTVFGILALNAKSKFNDNPTTANADAAERNALIADMSFGIALTLGITGVVLLTARDEEAEPTAKRARVLAARSRKNLATTKVAVAPYGHPTGAGATAHIRF